MSSKSLNNCFYYGLKCFRLKGDEVVISNNVLSKLSVVLSKDVLLKLAGHSFDFITQPKLTPNLTYPDLT